MNRRRRPSSQHRRRRRRHWRTKTSYWRSSSTSLHYRPRSPAPPSSASAGASSSPIPNSSATSAPTTAKPHSLDFSSDAWMESPSNPSCASPTASPPSRFAMPESRFECWDFVGCRNGLALLIIQTRLEAVVWDPITRHQRCVSFPPGFDENYATLVRNAARICASGESHDQVHGDCGLHPFKLVLVQGTGRIGEPQRVLAYLYDSESGVWGNVISAAIKHGIHAASPNVLVGNALYWLLNGGEILELDFERQSLVVIDRPAAVPHGGYVDFQILRTRENRFGFAMWTEMGIQIWEMKGNSDSVARWERQDIIKFDKLPPLGSRSRFYIAAFDEDTNAIFLNAITDRTFMVQLESTQFRRIPIKHYFQVYPYTNFYIAGRGISDGSGVEMLHDGSGYIPMSWVG